MDLVHFSAFFVSVLESLHHFCHGDVSADAPVKGTFLTLTTQTLKIRNGETCSVEDLLYSAACHMSNFITQSICLG